MTSRLFILTGILLFIACQSSNNEKKVLEHQKLQGYWMTSKAYRQGKSTRLLNDFYLHFIGEQAELNLPNTSKIAWKIDGDTLLLPEHPFQKMVLHRLTDSSLQVSFDFNRYLYWVELEKDVEKL